MPPTFNACWQATLTLTPRWSIGTTIAARGLRFGCWATATTRKMRCRRPSCARTRHSIGIRNGIGSARGCIAFW